ncbi:glycosyltransferase [Novosphingobium profundi]|uniref:glycosyltransferase n=1 Tax=Novosphingobium profundi TaxID=1774954 RepID=UPI001BDA450A|nr:glycosyltransferase [Novosphingobium profundi]MBT0667244.1 glycosyltransferase [Novosphingobium profundi]
MPVPAISVAMSVYNAERFLADAIDSVLGQSFADFEFLIVDDGSTDGSADIICAYAGRDARIRPVIRENRGLIASLNELLERAQAPLFARMDADDVCLPERFGAQHTFLEAHPDYGVVGTWTLDIDEAGKPYRLHGRDHPVDHASFLEAIEKDQPLICHPAAMMRRDVVRSVGGYHAAFRHCEDYDLWLRLASVTRLGNIPERLVRYRHYDEQVSSRHITEQQIGAAIAKTAYRERSAGRPDPTATLAQLPSLDTLDALFGREGTAREVRRQVAPNLLYSRKAMAEDGFALLCQYVREGGRTPGLWRAAARLAAFGMPRKAAHLAALLALG